MPILFVSDLHLTIDKPKVCASFIRFLHNEAKNSSALYILGDLFEFWIGDDDPTPPRREISLAISALVNLGIPCYFIHGNRDFLIGNHYARASGMTLLSEEKVLDLYGRRILIMHGDTLCTNDIAYQKFRAKVHISWIQKSFLYLPIFIRNHIATRMRNISKYKKNIKYLNDKEVNLQVVTQVIKKYDVQWIIHGHTHLPNLYKVNINGVRANRVVLGAWNSEGSMVKVTPDNVELITFPI